MKISKKKLTFEGFESTIKEINANEEQIAKSVESMEDFFSSFVLNTVG
jgi:hypothetical protein